MRPWLSSRRPSGRRACARQPGLTYGLQLRLPPAQAAAKREYPGHHPVLGVPDVRAYLQQRAVMQRSLERGACPVTQLAPALDGLLSLDCKRIARLDCDDTQLAICDATTGELLRQLDLPDVPSEYCPAETGGWDPSGQYLTLLFGGVWAHDWSYSSRESCTSGLAFLNLTTGTSVVQLLPDQSSTDGRVSTKFCPTRGLVALHHLDSAGTWVFSIWDCTGSQVARAESPEPDSEDLSCHGCSWSPSGQALLLRELSSSPVAWLWQFASAEPQVVSAEHDEDESGRFTTHAWAWATPYSGPLVLGAFNCQLVFCNPGGECALVPLPSQLAACRVRLAAWGVRLLLLAHSDHALFKVYDQCDQLQLYSVHSGKLALQQVLSLPGQRRYNRVQLKLSADGELAAALSSTPSESGAVTWSLIVVQLLTGRLFETPLPADVPDLRYARLRWSTDSTAVLINGDSEPRYLCKLVDT